MKYAFVLGRSRELSVAELGSVLGPELEVLKSGVAAFFDGELPGKSAQEFLNRLGGTMEIVEIVARGIDFANLQGRIEELLKSKFEGAMGKCAFAVNLLPENKNSHVLKMMLPKMKKTLRATGISANFMNNNFQNASSVLVVKQGLLRRGTNINIIEEGEGKAAIGFSVAMQDFEGYSKRDFDKPFRDANMGMMPPKLAQMMINLAGQPGMIVDPFCGSGTILMEALLMKHNVIGCDSEVRISTGAEKNVEWLRKNFIIGADLYSKISHKSALEVGALIAAEQTKQIAVVSEPYLGPTLSSWPAENFLNKVIAELSDLYTNFFKNLANAIPSGTPVVLIFPVWHKDEKAEIHLLDAVIDKITSLGYSKTAFVPLQKTSLIYDRPGQIVRREIVRFIKN